jgi:cysteine synthase
MQNTRDIIKTIGRTSFSPAQSYSPHKAEFPRLWSNWREGLNLSASMKDRIGISMIQSAEEAGLI